MENKKVKELIQNTFDDVAKNYDGNKYFVISAKEMVSSIKNIFPLGNKNINILDLSSGTGNIAIELSKQYPKAAIDAVDISEEMLKMAKQKTEKEGIENITYHMQDVENLQFSDKKFDIITCGYGLFFYPKMDAVLKDVCARLQKDGICFFYIYKRGFSTI